MTLPYTLYPNNFPNHLNNYTVTQMNADLSLINCIYNCDEPIEKLRMKLNLQCTAYPKNTIMSKYHSPETFPGSPVPINTEAEGHRI